MGEVSFRGAQRLSNPQGAASPDIALQRAERIEPLGPFDSLAQTLGYGNAEQLVNNLPIAGMTNLFPKNIQNLFSRELAEAVWEHFQKTPKIARAATDMITSPRHQAISSTLSGLEPTTESRLLGSYSLAHTPEDMRDIVARKISPLLNSNTKIALLNGSDEYVARMAQEHGGKIRLSERLENEPIAEIYKTLRHEFSHAADDLAGKSVGPSFGLRGEDPRYWVNLAEVRARAAEGNYARDMTGRAEPRSIINYSQLKEPAKWSQRQSYTQKIIDEINRGKNIADDKFKEGLPGNIIIGASNNYPKELSNTTSHYFGPTLTKSHTLAPGDISFTTDIKATKPRLEIPRSSTNPLRPSYDWEQTIRPNVITSPTATGSGLTGPSARAYEDLLARLRGKS